MIKLLMLLKKYPAPFQQWGTKLICGGEGPPIEHLTNLLLLISKLKTT